MQQCDRCQQPAGALFIRILCDSRWFLCHRCIEEQGREIRRALRERATEASCRH